MAHKRDNRRKKRVPFKERMKVEMYDSHLRYVVESEHEEGASHLVDIGEWQCSCTDYSVRHASLYKQTGDRQLCSCKHLKRVWQHLLTNDELFEIVITLLDTYDKAIQQRRTNGE